MARGDYVEALAEKSVVIGLAETQGGRSEQEDFLVGAVNKISQFPNLSEVDRASSMVDAFSQLQAEHGNLQNTGSTANATIAWLDNNGTLQATTANLGDSTSFLVVLNENNELISCNLMHKLHVPDPQENSEEYERVRAVVAPFKKGLGDPWRLASGLAMSRSLGDQHSELFGLSHRAEITVTQQKLLPGQHAFIVVACDGLTELDINDNVQVSPRDIGLTIAKGLQQQSSLPNLAKHLVNLALNKGSADNISVAVFAVTNTPTSAAVFDGHGGNRVSFDAGKAFYSVLENTVRKKLSLGQSIETVPNQINYDNLYEGNKPHVPFFLRTLGVSLEVGDPNVGLPRNLPPVNRNGKNNIATNVTPTISFAKEIKIVDEIKKKTDKFMQQTNDELINKILSWPKNSPLRNKLIAMCANSVANPHLHDRASKATLTKIILTDYAREFHEFVDGPLALHIRRSMLASNSKDSSRITQSLKILINQHHHGIVLQESMRLPDPHHCIDSARIVFKDPLKRKELEKGNGFWGKIFQLLGLTPGQKLGKFFDKQEKSWLALTHTKSIKAPRMTKKRK